MKKNNFTLNKNKRTTINALALLTFVNIASSDIINTIGGLNSDTNNTNFITNSEAAANYKQLNLNPNFTEKHRKLLYYMVSTGNGLASLY